MSARFRVDEGDPPDVNGAVAWYTRWMGGPTLALVRNCPVVNVLDPDTPISPRTVYASDHPVTFFSIPARCKFRGRTFYGYLTRQDGAWQFRVTRKSNRKPETST